MYHVPCQFADKTYRSVVWNILDEHWGLSPFGHLHWQPKTSTMKLQLEGPTKKKDHQNLPFLNGSFLCFLLAPLKSRSEIPLCVLEVGQASSLGRMPVSDHRFSPCPPLISFFFVLTPRAMSQKKDRKRLYLFLVGVFFFKIAMFQGTQQWKKLCQLVIV